MDPVKRVPVHEEWDVVLPRPDGLIMCELVEDGKCVKRRYYPALTVIYIEETGLEKA